MVCSRRCGGGLLFTGDHIDSNRNQICCVNIEECMVFGSIVGSDYYIQHMPTRQYYDYQRNVVIRTKYDVLTYVGVHGFGDHRGF